MDNALPLPLAQPTGRWRFDWLPTLLFRPRTALAAISAVETPVWQVPLTLLLLGALVRTLVDGSVRQALAQMQGPVLPQGFEYYTAEQQAQFMQALQATSGPVFVYLLPAVLSLLGVLLGWLLLSGVLYLLLTLAGDRRTSGQTRNLVAWALVPFVIRDIVRIGALWTSGQPLTYLGLSGFAPPPDGNGAIFLGALLTAVNLYLLWHAGLLIAGVHAGGALSRRKGWLVVCATLLSLYLLRAVPAVIAAQFSDLTVIRPFF